MNILFILFIFLSLLINSYAGVVDPNCIPLSMMDDMKHPMTGFYGPYPITREVSGTSWQPESTPMIGIHSQTENWKTMIMGFASLFWDHQGGPRGGKKFASTNMLMIFGQHDFGKAGKLGFRSMISLEGLMGRDGYPLLLQTGETANGITPLIDRQHPHDFFMALAITYQLPINDKGSIFGYAGIPGEPAIGPPIFMMRYSGTFNPEAPLGHHWQDSTHITWGVLTAGFIWNKIKIDTSLFTGREPDQHRFDFERPRFDSISVRLSYNPTPNWALQFSYAFLTSPEQLEPEVDIQRFTASAIYNKRFCNWNWQTIFLWGRNVEDPGSISDAYLLESTINFNNKHVVFGRFDRVGNDELFLENEPLHGILFKVNKLTVGYIYQLFGWNHTMFGLGMLVSVPFLPFTLDEVYGFSPLSYMAFLQIRIVDV